MKRGYSLLSAAGASVLLITVAQPTFGQSVPTQGEIERALRPIPLALQGGHQGINPGPGLRAETNPSYTRASISGTVANSGTRVGRTAPRRDQASAAPAAGCPSQSEASGRAMKDFKIAFEFGSAQLKPESTEILRRLGKALNEGLSDQKLFEIEGHTDAVGPLPYNEQLSKLRAEAVKDFLVRDMGVSPDRLAVVGKAYCEPADPRNPYGAENRRVVVVNQAS